MVEVTLNPETPTETVTKAANMTATVLDAKGRKITVKKLNALDRMRLFELVGSENVTNEAYFGYASLAYHVTEIDGDPIIRPATKTQLEGLVQRLDDDGMNAVAKAVADNFLAKQPDDVREAVKNA